MQKKISKKELRNFGLLTGLGSPILLGWLIPLIMGHAFKVWTLYLGVLGITIGLIAPFLLYYPFKIWTKLGLGYALSWVNSRILLGLVFIAVLLPIALVMRLFGYDPLRIHRKGQKTYRENKKKYEVDFFRIF